MAKDLQLMQRQVMTPAQQVTGGNAFDQLGQAVGQVSEILSSKASAIAVEQAATQGALAAEKDELPKDLAIPLTPATAAYNKAASTIEANRMINSAQAQANEALIQMSNPATFNSNTPAQFQATIEGIVQGTLEHTRDENRAQISGALQQIASSTSLKMLDHSIKFDNQQMKNDAETDLTNIQTQLKDATIAGNTELASALTQRFNETLNNYSEMNNEIKRSAPEVRQKFEQAQQINEVLAGFSKASEDGTTSQYLNDFAQNKQNLPFDQWQKAGNELIKLQGQEQSLKHALNAEQVQIVSNGIENNTIQTPGDITLFKELTPVQQLQAMNKLETHQRSQFKNVEKILNVQNHILKGQPALNTGSTLDEMFELSQTQFESATGRSMTIMDMADSVMGTNEFPISGLRGTPVGRDVPAINAQMKSMLTSRDPAKIVQAASVYNRLVNVDKQPNSIDISGKSLSIASMFNVLNQGDSDPIALATSVSDAVMNLSEQEFNSRVDTFNSTFLVKKSNGKSGIDEIFKNVTGVNPQGSKTSNALDLVKTQFKMHYLNTNSEEAAIKATQYDLRALGQSKYFEDGVVSLSVPEKELSITQIGHTFDNQYRIRVQDVINNNSVLRAQGLNVPTIEWLEPAEQTINTARLTDDEKVFSRLGAAQDRPGLATVADTPKPRIKVNGRETDVVLQDVPGTRLGERLQYAMYYHDQFGMLQPIEDISNPMGVAMFSPAGLEEYAPAIFEGKREEELKQTAVRMQREQGKRELEQIKGAGALGKLFPQADMGMKLLRDPEGTSKAFRKIFSTDADEIKNILHQKIQGRPAEQLAQAQEQAATADNVGIAAVPQLQGAD